LRVVTILYCLCEYFFTDYFSFLFPIFTLFRHFHMKFVFHFLQLFFVFFFLHYLHEESFFFCIVFTIITIHMNSEPFFYHPYYFFHCWCFFFFFSCTTHMNNPFLFLFFCIIITTHVTIQVNSAPFSNIFSLFTWSMQFSKLFTWIATFFYFFPAIVLHYSHQQSILVKKINTIHIVELIHQIMTWHVACI